MSDLWQFRRDTASNWTSANPTLADGELGLETDTLKCKIGDGSTAWTSLAYAAFGDIGLDNTSQWTKNQSVAPSALSDGSTIAVDASLSNNFKVTLGGNRTLANPTNLADGMVLNFVIKQDATGSRTLAYGSKYKWPGGTAPTLSTAANAIDFFSAYYDSASGDLLCNMAQAFA